MSKMDDAEKEVLGHALKKAIKASPEARFLHRLHCVQLVSQNHKAYEVASWFGDDPSSVSRWARHFNTFGVEGLHDDQKTGRLAKINYDQMQALKKELEKPPSAQGYNKTKWDGHLLATYLQERYQVEYSLRQCQRLLLKLREAGSVTDTYKRTGTID